ncbi:hypothetical protein CWI38_0380p0050 [Hamiltosporidium tvaerminnensis]|uniref:Uncharacterized protein n=2 Tax=Hamiltosporidium tvaerminnensis TaxID=1176355 RepID=A0A4Q9LZ96_9MICR|nr:hypothetical protein CWI38_0380p0050 [Hamiltosporidium tvaerminnensis]
MKLDNISRKDSLEIDFVPIYFIQFQSTNHFLIIDDLKLFCQIYKTLEKMTEEKSETNNPCCEDTASFLKEYSLNKIQSEGIPQLKRLCCTKPNVNNLFSAINQHAISSIDYHIVLLRLEPADFSKINDAVRAVLRLYPLKQNLEDVFIVLSCELLDSREKSKKISTRRAAIFKNLEKAQLAKLYNEIEKRKLHSKLYNARKNELVSFSDSSRGLKKGNIRSRNEAVFCYIQDRNVLCGSEDICQDCIKSQILENEHKQIKGDTKIKTDFKIRLGITSQDSFQIVETEKLRKYDLLANDVEIISFGINWNGIVTKYPRKYVKRLIVLNKTSGINAEESWKSGPEPTPPLIQPNNVEIVLNILKQKIKNLKFWIEELNININIESDLKEENAYYDKNILNEKFIK